MDGVEGIKWHVTRRNKNWWTRSCTWRKRGWSVTSKPEDESMNWSAEKPTVPGMYLFKCRLFWPYRLVVIEAGDWRRAQNPAELYVSGLDFEVNGYRSGPLADIHMAAWMGPMPRAREWE